MLILAQLFCLTGYVVMRLTHNFTAGKLSHRVKKTKTVERRVKTVFFPLLLCTFHGVAILDFEDLFVSKKSLDQHSDTQH